MQNKGAIILLSIVLALVSIYQLSFTGATYKVKNDAKKYAKGVTMPVLTSISIHNSQMMGAMTNLEMDS